MDLVHLSKMGDSVKFIFGELSEAYDANIKKDIVRLQDMAWTCLFWYYLEMGDTLRDYQEEAEKMLDEEKERTDVMDLIKKLRYSFNEIGDDLREISQKQIKSGLTSIPD